MRIATAIAVIASILFVGWARNRLIVYEKSLEKMTLQEEEPLLQGDVGPDETKEEEVPTGNLME